MELATALVTSELKIVRPKPFEPKWGEVVWDNTVIVRGMADDATLLEVARGWLKGYRDSR